MTDRTSKKYVERLNEFIRKHADEGRWSPFDRFEYRAMQLFAEQLDREGITHETSGEWIPLDHDLIVNGEPVRMRRKGSPNIPQWEMWRAVKSNGDPFCSRIDKQEPPT